MDTTDTDTDAQRQHVQAVVDAIETLRARRKAHYHVCHTASVSISMADYLFRCLVSVLLGSSVPNSCNPPNIHPSQPLRQ